MPACGSSTVLSRHGHQSDHCWPYCWLCFCGRGGGVVCSTRPRTMDPNQSSSFGLTHIFPRSGKCVCKWRFLCAITSLLPLADSLQSWPMGCKMSTHFFSDHLPAPLLCFVGVVVKLGPGRDHLVLAQTSRWGSPPVCWEVRGSVSMQSWAHRPHNEDGRFGNRGLLENRGQSICTICSQSIGVSQFWWEVAAPLECPMEYLTSVRPVVVLCAPQLSHVPLS